MKDWFFSRNGAISLSVLTLLSQVWRGFLDAMFILPNDFGDEGLMQLAAVIFTLLFTSWAWALFLTWQGSRRGLIAAFVINGLVLIVIPIGWLFFYCPADCRANAGVFNFANSLNLVLGVLTAVSLTFHLRQKPQPTVGASRL
ncbi:MAG: hypothetical protein DWQ04_28315 [Chloroflexi bacterium]|nr:MAG: hypothetical protein DWQ04_28315 [Chloroflexota bacterium]